MPRPRLADAVDDLVEQLLVEAPARRRADLPWLKKMPCAEPDRGPPRRYRRDVFGDLPPSPG
jgi:hypothetical protein